MLQPDPNLCFPESSESLARKAFSLPTSDPLLRTLRQSWESVVWTEAPQDLFCPMPNKWALNACFSSPYALVAVLSSVPLPDALSNIVADYMPFADLMLQVSGSRYCKLSLTFCDTYWFHSWSPSALTCFELTKSRKAKVAAAVLLKGAPFWLQDSYILEPKDHGSLLLLNFTPQVTSEKGFFALVEIKADWLGAVATFAKQLWGKELLPRILELLSAHVSVTWPTATRLLVFQPRDGTRLYLTPICKDTLVCVSLLLKAVSMLPVAFEKMKQRFEDLEQQKLKIQDAIWRTRNYPTRERLVGPELDHDLDHDLDQDDFDLYASLT